MLLVVDAERTVLVVAALRVVVVAPVLYERLLPAVEVRVVVAVLFARVEVVVPTLLRVEAVVPTLWRVLVAVPLVVVSTAACVWRVLVPPATEVLVERATAVFALP